MKLPLVVAAVGVGLVAATTSGPSGMTLFSQSAPPNPQLIRALGRSQLPLLADIVWIRAIAITINLKVPADGLSLITWCGLVTDLDGKFVWPYILAGLLGPMSFGDKHYNVSEANQLLMRGTEQLPNDFRLPLYLSYNQLHLEQDVAAAAQTLRRGARAPGAPLFMAQLATRLLAESNSFDAARAFAAELEQSSSDPSIRAFFERRRLEVERDEQMAKLQSAVEAFRAARGHLPQSLVELRSEGFLAELPVEPLGGEFRLGADGSVFSTSGARLKAYFQPETP